ncbi:MAG: hypothetical protein JJT75_13065 [Opitutales bacterium]|nr:hypothetical protein [Opitutales bacterium]MCH8540181.1 hypothetical protein [Opitutales bacterium]
MEIVEKIIKNVLELPGVDGACLIDKKGEILHNALPEFFLTEFFDDLSRRIMNLFSTVEDNYLSCDEFLLKYPQKFILMRRSRTVHFIAIVDPSTNLVSLRMVSNIVLKHVTPKVLQSIRKEKEAMEPSPVPVVRNDPPEPKAIIPEPEPQVQPEPEPEPKVEATAAKPRRMYRGSYY